VSNSISRSSIAIVAVLAAAAGLVGCGVRGSLESPVAAPAETAPADSGQGKKAGDAAKPHQGSILDGLLR
jgi:predicted small lipoprotein YifL